VLSTDEWVNEPVMRDVFFHGDARSIRDDQVADRSVALMITSPPYFAGKEYEIDLAAGHVPSSYVEYLEMLRDVLAVALRKLEPGGRMAVNVANLGRKPYRSLSADVISILQDDLGMLMRGEVIWQKARGAGGSCAWGSFRSPQNPVLRDVTERVIIASKGRFDRALSRGRRETEGRPHQATIDTGEFLEATLDVWEIPSESARKVGHPAPFPVALPRRLIELYTYRDDLVLDPFMGSGTTAVAAVRSGRHFVGFDTEEVYVEMARARVAGEPT
jgi:site-specific DNA-methyltransferase (adenine-specific)